jgi:hypothetical protein
MRREAPAETHYPAFAVPVLAVAVTLAALANWYAFTAGIAVSPAPPAGTTSEVVLDLPAPPRAEAAAAPTVFAETLARPLFRSSRRPAEAKAATSETAEAGDGQAIAADLPGGLQLAGIVQEGGKPGRALIRSPESPTGSWVEIGHELEGWRLSEIGAQSIVFEAGGVRHTLPLFRSRTQ